MRRPSLLLRPDTRPHVGMGHVMRSVALAEAWVARGGRATIVHDPTPSLASRMEVAGIEFAPPSSARTDGTRSDWVALDGYDVDEERQDDASSEADHVLVIDDNGSIGRYRADLVLDQNLGATASDYGDRSSRTELLLGPRYALLRREFWGLEHESHDVADEVEDLLVLLGGSPPASAIEAAVTAVGVAGLDRIAHVPGRESPITDMRAALARADLVLSASGTTAWELCLAGVPSVLVPVADNQQPVAAALAAAGAAEVGDLGDPVALGTQLRRLADDRRRRSELATRAKGILDSRGSRRVVTAMRKRLVMLRPATMSDAELLFSWVNEPTTRAMSFSTAQVDWVDHLRWLEGRLADPAVRLWIASWDGAPLGQVRLDVGADRRAEVSISVDAAQRGQGWAGAVLAATMEAARRDDCASALDAWIKPDNTASIHAFDEAGFTLAGSGSRGDGGAVRYAASLHDG